MTSGAAHESTGIVIAYVAGTLATVPSSFMIAPAEPSRCAASGFVHSGSLKGPAPASWRAIASGKQ